MSWSTKGLGLKRKATQRGGGCCVAIPVLQRSGWTSLRPAQLNASARSHALKRLYGKSGVESSGDYVKSQIPFLRPGS